MANLCSLVNKNESPTISRHVQSFHAVRTLHMPTHLGEIVVLVAF